MPIISVGDNENNRWKRNANKKDKDRKKGDKSYSKRVRANCFCCTFKLGFLQLVCKASLIFKSNLELALSIILKEKGGGVTTSFANIARTTASASKCIY